MPGPLEEIRRLGHVEAIDHTLQLGERAVQRATDHRDIHCAQNRAACCPPPEIGLPRCSATEPHTPVRQEPPPTPGTTPCPDPSLPAQGGSQLRCAQERFATRTACCSDVGSSPRARRAVHRPRRPRRSVRTIPAGAGSSDAFQVSMATDRGHPYIRGEQPGKRRPPEPTWDHSHVRGEQQAAELRNDPAAAPSAKNGARSRQTTSTPGRWASHAARLDASRSGSKSIGRRVSTSTRTVP